MKQDSELLRNFSSSVMRATDTLENTFANKSSRTINIRCIFVVNDTMNIGAAAEPIRSSSTKPAYTSDDFNGCFTGQPAHVNNLEHLWKYGMNLYGDPNITDVAIHYYSPVDTFGGFYIQENTAGYKAGEMDVETVTPHEMGHVPGFNTGQDTGDGKLALDLLARTETGDKWLGDRHYFTGDRTTALNSGQEVQLMSGATGFDSHIMKPNGCIMNDGTQNSGTMRQYTDLDLAMFQDMGWTLAVPEPSSALLVLAGFASLLARRRRGNDAHETS